MTSTPDWMGDIEPPTQSAPGYDGRMSYDPKAPHSGAGGGGSTPAAPPVVSAVPPGPAATAPVIAGTGSAGCTVTATSTPGGQTGTAVVDGTGAWSITLAGAAWADGQHCVTATQVCAAPNDIPSAPTTEQCFTITTVPASTQADPPVVTAVPTGPFAAPPAITGTGSVGCTVTATATPGGQTGTAVVDAGGAWTITLAGAAWTDGENCVTATQVCAAPADLPSAPTTAQCFTIAAV